VNSEIVSVILRSAPQNAAAESLALWALVDAFQAVARDEVAAEAYIHLGQNYVRLAQPAPAAEAFARAEALAKTPYEMYLSRLFAGAIFERSGRHTDAIAAFRGALQAVPRAQSTSIALAPLLLALDAKAEVADILTQAMTLPRVEDPLQYYILGDPTAVPRAFARIRQDRR
jgi:tetratricopeptide (TPR) repeat protein